MANGDERLFRRDPANPILTAAEWPYPANSVFNPGATRLGDGSTLLMCRVEDHRGISHLCAARSADGRTAWQIDARPTLLPDLEGHPEELWGIEDPRITFIPELDQFALVYTSYSRGGPGVSLALTRDFREFQRMGAVMPPWDKDAALLPRRFSDHWVMIHRPTTAQDAHIWMSRSPDLRHWGHQQLILESRRGAWWDANKIGLSPPPIETPQGWLLLYHGVRVTASGSLYRLGLALLDLDEPGRCIRRGERWILGPEAPYERFGDVNNVVFPCGVTLADDGDTLNVYYGAADTCIALATASMAGLLAWLLENGA